MALGGFGISRVVGGPSSPDPSPDVIIRPERSTVELGARSVDTWTYGGSLPGPELRLPQGRPVRIRVDNDLPEPTSVHWHGIRLQNAADGVPGLTQEAIPPGGSHLYEFSPPDAGTYFFHSHVGVQLDRGLYAPLIIDARDERSAPDEDVVLMLDDWLDGTGATPDDRLDELMHNGMGMGMGGKNMGGKNMGGKNMGGKNMGGKKHGRQEHGRQEHGRHEHGRAIGRRAPPGSRGDAPCRGIAGGPRQCDGGRHGGPGGRARLPAPPRQRPAPRGRVPRARAPGRPGASSHRERRSRYDLLRLRRGRRPVRDARRRPARRPRRHRRCPDRNGRALRRRRDGSRRAGRIIALALGKQGRAVAVLRPRGSSARATAPSAPYAMPRRIVDYADLRPIRRERRLTGAQETILDLGMGDGSYSWTIGGQVFDQADPIRVERDAAQRFVMRNRTMMAHPMHLHGHSFRPVDGGPLKDTILVPPMREVAVDWVPDNPGSWAFHCHNACHAEAGMMRRVEVS